ncbi:SAP domain containing protein [Nitzschia inconspicua]|uniref:SAP domain containing protein n=1 Tax=Nitzschia inconspicua TaxID=303405 RepID=A0A9K3KMP5_9STRA|nr:SAP domain containing protein [Nitzschia inconspicua]
MTRAFLPTASTGPSRNFDFPQKQSTTVSIVHPFSSSSSSSSSFTRLFADLWDRMKIEEDEEPNWYLLNCVAGLEMDLLQQCRMKCGALPDVVKFVAPTITKTRSHGAKRMVQDTKVKYQGYVFAKLRLTRDTYMAIQTLDLCRSWMGTINMKGYKKLPPAPLPLTEEEIENFDLENFKWLQDEPEIVSIAAAKNKERTVIMDTEDYDIEENRILNEIEEEVQNVYKGLKVEDMVKVISKGKFYNEDGIVRRLKEGMILIRFFTYGTVFDEWLDPSEVRKLTEAEILKGLGGPSAPITQQDLDGPRQNDRQREDRFDRRNEVGSFGGGRDRRQDRTERRFRNDSSGDDRGERDNWNWYQQKERRSREGGYSDGKEHIRGSADQGESRGNFWAEGDVDSQWGRNNNQQRNTNRRDQQRQPRENQRTQQYQDWSSFISKSTSPKSGNNKREPPSKEETDDFFASLMSDLSSSDSSGNSRSDYDFDDERSDDDFFASLMSEVNEDQSQPKSGSVSSSKAAGDDQNEDDDDFFASLEREIRGSTRESKPTNSRQETKKRKDVDVERQLDDIFAELSMEMQDTSSSSSFDSGEDDFFASLEMELASDLAEKKQGKPVTRNSDTPSLGADDDDFFASLEAELSEDLGRDTNRDTSNDDDFFASLETELGSVTTETMEDPAEEKKKEKTTTTRKTKADSSPPLAEQPKPNTATSSSTNSPKVIDVSALQDRTIPELKDMLRERGLKVSGKKAELIERLTTTATS